MLNTLHYHLCILSILWQEPPGFREVPFPGFYHHASCGLRWRPMRPVEVLEAHLPSSSHVGEGGGAGGARPHHAASSGSGRPREAGHS